MRVVRLAALFAWAALSICATAEAQEAIREGSVLTGKLRLVSSRHPNGTRLEAYQIVSSARMMPPNDDFCDYDNGATTFHLFTMAEALKKQLKPLLGKSISVKTNALFCSETAWHIGDVAVPDWTLLPK